MRVVASDGISCSISRDYHTRSLSKIWSLSKASSASSSSILHRVNWWLEGKQEKRSWIKKQKSVGEIDKIGIGNDKIRTPEDDKLESLATETISHHSSNITGRERDMVYGRQRGLVTNLSICAGNLWSYAWSSRESIHSFLFANARSISRSRWRAL